MAAIRKASFRNLTLHESSTHIQNIVSSRSACHGLPPTLPASLPKTLRRCVEDYVLTEVLVTNITVKQRPQKLLDTIAQAVGIVCWRRVRDGGRRSGIGVTQESSLANSLALIAYWTWSVDTYQVLKLSCREFHAVLHNEVVTSAPRIMKSSSPSGSSLLSRKSFLAMLWLVLPSRKFNFMPTFRTYPAYG